MYFWSDMYLNLYEIINLNNKINTTLQKIYLNSGVNIFFYEINTHYSQVYFL